LLGSASSPAEACYEDGEIKVFFSNRRDARLFARHVGFLGIKNGKLGEELLPIPQASRALSKDFVPYLASYVRSEAGGRWTDRDWLNRHNIDRIDRWEREGESILTRIASEEVKSVIRPLVAGIAFAVTITTRLPGLRPWTG
jgi:DNA gyrase subunit A